jgi:predicted ribosome quality control (RQC) complex YloA/Tae2 family protein
MRRVYLHFTPRKTHDGRVPFKPFNWKEIALLSDAYRSEIEGLFVDRIIVPERSRFPGGYLKGEWVIRLTGRQSEGTFLFSVRARYPYFAFMPGKGPRAAPLGTRSPFDLEVTKRLKGARLKSLETLPRERSLILWFSDSSEREALGLVLNLMPAAPEALLIRGKPPAANWATLEPLGYPIITRSRANRDAGSSARFLPPDGANAPVDPPVRDEVGTSKQAFARNLEHELELEAFGLRLTAANRGIRELAKQCRDRIRQTETALRESKSDSDWKLYGDLLKAVLHEEPALEPTSNGKSWVRRVRQFDAEYEKSEWVSLPADPKLSPAEQIQKYYQLARRRARRIEESSTRLEALSETLVRLDGLLLEPPPLADFKALERLERAASPATATSTPENKGPSKKAWLGKTFVSKEGLTIMVGRSKDENLELTFKHARGNDIWMHVRGRPGAHVLIPMQPGKSPPLETLLDGAVLAIYYSGGENWGKTEVDYAYKKYVKRIKDSSEASYANNKTLIIEPEAARIKRLII